MSCSRTYMVRTVIPPTDNIYSSYEDKIPGSWLFALDDSVINSQRQIKGTYICAAHNYISDISNVMAISLSNTIETVFEKTIKKDPQYINEGQINTEAKGSILVKLDRLESRLSCRPGLGKGKCSATTEIKIGIIVNGQKKRLLSSSVDNIGIADGSSGTICEGAAEVISSSISRSLQGALENIGERLSNSAKLRDL